MPHYINSTLWLANNVKHIYFLDIHTLEKLLKVTNARLYCLITTDNACMKILEYKQIQCVCIEKYTQM